MRVFNLTDVPTPTLQANGLVNVKLRVAGALIEPGSFADVTRLQPSDQRLIGLQAIADHEPVSYLQAKAKLSPPVPLAPEKVTLKPAAEVGVEDNVMISEVFPEPVTEAEPSPFSEPPMGSSKKRKRGR